MREQTSGEPRNDSMTNSLIEKKVIKARYVYLGDSTYADSDRSCSPNPKNDMAIATAAKKAGLLASTLEGIKGCFGFEGDSTYTNPDIIYCRNTKKDIVMVPAGQMATICSDVLAEYNVKVSFFADNNQEKVNTCSGGIEIISLSQVLKNKDKFSVVLCCSQINVRNALVKQLEEAGVTDYHIAQRYYYPHGYQVPLTKISALEWLTNYNRYKRLYNSLSDELSRKTLNHDLLFRLFGDNIFVKEIKQESQNKYFDVAEITKDDCIVDCGAFTGDTLLSCMDKNKEGVAAYYAFEPGKASYKTLSITAAGYANTTVFNLGVWSSKAATIGSFCKNSSDSSATVVKAGSSKMNVVALDEELKDKKVTFIKMDVECAELEALKGAENIIKTQKPTLAISVHRRFRDLFDIPELIQSMGVDYNYYLRHYSDADSEIVFYAVPRGESEANA